ncbi:MAG: NADP-dependent malic enzyme [Alphaproteobacteria bacterium]|nr:MAG: NADP-dependent malic enzyme [Alphaproteobacteria bacterium]
MTKDKDLREAALEYHRYPKPGKLGTVATKPLETQRDLSLAYTPGVAVACEEIARDPIQSAELTGRGNLVGVITNGTAVLGLGAIGPEAAKPVMEGKAVLFKKFAGIDVFDLEVNERNVDKFVDIVAALEPTFGGINLEDIKAPECFEIERKLCERMKIPVFHDDQHGTSIIVGAAVVNGLKLVDKKIDKVKFVCSGAGAAALSCLDLLVSLGLKRENIWVCDIAGVVYEGRKEEMDSYKSRYARKTDARKLADVIKDADVFLGLSAGKVLTGEMVKTMAKNPIVMAMANPVPEIMPEEIMAARSDAVIATGRSDYPNQVNNVLCFPYIFRGALDVGATTINQPMKLAAVQAIAELAHVESSDVASRAYGDAAMSFGRDYIIPKPFDPRLILKIAPAVAKAAMDSGVATRPIKDFEAYHQDLSQFVFRSGLVMKPVFEAAKENPQRIVYAEGEDERVLRAIQVVVDEGLAKPIIIGRPDVIKKRIEKSRLRIKAGKDFEMVNPDSDPRFAEYWGLYHRLMERRGISPDQAKTVVRTRNTIIAALMIKRGEADALICGTSGKYQVHLNDIMDIIGLNYDVHVPSALNVLILTRGIYFMCDTYVTDNPTAHEIAEMTIQAAEAVRRFGIEPKVALLSHSNFGSSEAPSARKMREALSLIHMRAPSLEIEGEMHADAAVNEEIRNRIFPNSRLMGSANLFVMPTLDAANISYNILKALGDGLSIGPILLGVGQPAHVLTPSVTVRGIVNMTAIAAVEAHGQEGTKQKIVQLKS